MLIGLVGVLYTMFMWWRDVVKESHKGDHTAGRVAASALRHAAVHRLGSDVLRRLVLGLFRCEPVLRRRHAASRIDATGGVWPPKGIEVFDPWHLPLINTLILLTSGTTVTWAHHALLNNDRKGLKWGLPLTIVLGLAVHRRPGL